MRPCEPMAGFSLLELLVSLSLGMLLSGVILQGLLADGQNSQRVSRLLRERAVQRRTLALVKAELAQATAVSEAPQQEASPCSLAGRLPVLHLSTPAGAITYSVGASPSAIWRGQVLMRCGPAYGLDGQLSTGSQALNRVVIDGLASQPEPWRGCDALLGAVAAALPLDLAGSSSQPFSACLDQRSGLLGLRLVQEFGDAKSSARQRVTSELLAPSLEAGLRRTIPAPE